MYKHLSIEYVFHLILKDRILYAQKPMNGYLKEEIENVAKIVQNSKRTNPYAEESLCKMN